MKEIRTALALMNSMILSGEDHSDQSLQVYHKAHDTLDNLAEAERKERAFDWLEEKSKGDIVTIDALFCDVIIHSRQDGNLATSTTLLEAIEKAMEGE